MPQWAGPSRSFPSFRHAVSRAVPVAIACACAFAAPPVSAGGPREEVNAAIDKLLTARSFAATLDGGDGRPGQQLEFAAPGRYRVRSGGDEQIIVGDTLYRWHNGRRVQAPLPQDALMRWRDPARLVEQAETMDVIALPDETIGGVSARKYRIEQPPTARALLLWIGADGYPLQVVTDAQAPATGTATTIRYSRFNDPGIRIDTPK